MCKLLIMTGISDSRVTFEFATRMAALMSKRNDDGIGYTAVNSKGELFSQRWLKNNLFLDTQNVMTAGIAAKLKKYESRLPKGALDVNYSQLGTVDYTDIKTITLHTRYATCGREFANTHPFIDQDTSLIHNGGISNYKTLDVNKISTCDSEAALQTYLSTGVKTDMKKAQEWINMLEGRWAFGVLARDEQNRRILDVVRGYSMLYYLEAPGIGRVFTTDKDDAAEVLKDMKLDYLVKPELINSNSMYRYDALTGNFLGDVELKDSIKNYKEPVKVVPAKTVNEIYYGSGTSGKWVNGKWVSYADLTQEQLDISLLNTGNGYDITDPAEAPFPDIYTHDGGYDFRKVNKYCNDEEGEPFIDRLSLWDEVYGQNTQKYFYELSAEERMEIEKVDFMAGFQEARNLIYKKAKSNRKA